MAALVICSIRCCVLLLCVVAETATKLRAYWCIYYTYTGVWLVDVSEVNLNDFTWKLNEFKLNWNWLWFFLCCWYDERDTENWRTSVEMMKNKTEDTETVCCVVNVACAESVFLLCVERGYLS